MPDFEARTTESDIIGYHGTSLEAVKILTATGILPGRKYDHKVLKEIKKGFLYFYPLESFVPPAGPIEFHQGYDPFDGAASYAIDRSREHRFLDSLDLEIGDDKNFELSYLAENGNYPPRNWETELYFDELLKMGFTQPQILTAVRRAYQRRGVVLGISSEVTNYFSILPDPDDGGLAQVIDTQNGLPKRFIKSLTPSGRIERAYLNRLNAEWNAQMAA